MGRKNIIATDVLHCTFDIHQIEWLIEQASNVRRVLERRGMPYDFFTSQRVVRTIVQKLMESRYDLSKEI